MTSTCVIEELSSYLDGEVSPKVRGEIREHLRTCPKCQHHLEGLRAVVDRLSSLERVMPPLTVAQAVYRNTATLTGRRRYLQRWERLARLLSFESSVLPFLALVIALAGIVLLFANAVERSQVTRSRLIWVGGQSQEPTRSDADELPTESAITQRKSPLPESSRGTSVEDTRVVAGRIFDQIGGSWIERGLGVADIADRQGETTSSQLVPFSELHGRVLLRIEGEIVEVVFGDSGPQPN